MKYQHKYENIFCLYVKMMFDGYFGIKKAILKLFNFEMKNIVKMDQYYPQPTIFENF